MGEPQPPSKEPIIIEDVLTTTREESPTKPPSLTKEEVPRSLLGKKGSN